ncbi:MAG: ABC transporter permease [Parasporobacterium sp.]|nr:ABC transporter permease [Parasporobacterium sp.]
MEQAKKKQSHIAEVWKQLKKNKVAVISLFVVIAIILIAIFAPVIAPYSFDATGDVPFEKSSLAHLLGTDKLGRDILSRLIYGARASLLIGIVSVAISAVIGIFIGSIAGYFGNATDNILMRLLDIYQSIPMMLLCLVLAAILGPSLKNAIIALAVSMIPQFARMMRASILTFREMEYVEAAQSINAGTWNVLIKDIIPNAISPLIVTITMNVGNAILIGAMLSFVGLGVQPPTPEWGTLIAEARNYMRANPTLAIYPGVCIMITVLAFNLLGDGLRDALDPRLKN